MVRPTVPPLRPLGLGDLLDDLFALYRRGFLIYILINACVLAPYAVLRLALGSQSEVYFLGGVLLWVAPFVVSQAASVQATSDLYLKGEVGSRGVVRELWRHRAGLVRLSLLWIALVPVWAGYMLYTTLGLVPPLLIVAAPIAFGAACWMAPWSLCVPVLLLENLQSSREALDRSKALVSGARRQIGLLLTILAALWGPTLALFYWVPWFGLQEFLGMDSTKATETLEVFTFAIGVFVPPYVGIGLTLLYYDRRVRAEGYDLIVRARALGQAGGADASDDRTDASGLP